MTKRLLLVCVILSALFAGCVRAGRTSGGMSLSNGRYCLYSYNGYDLHFLIVTDGNLGEHGVSKVIFMNPCWSGEIRPLSPNQPVISYKAGMDSIRINGLKYEFQYGRFFKICTKNSAPVIQQIQIPPLDQIRKAVEGDKQFDF